MDVDVLIAGAGPTGLMLARELRLAGVRPLVLERQPRPTGIPKANGLGGQILQLLRYRGLLDQLEAASSEQAHPALRYPFGDVHLDFSGLDDPPLRGLTLPQPQLESLLASGLDAEVRRGHEIVGAGQDGDAVTADVRGPDGRYQVRARYLVGCDGGRGRVRELAGIPFPGVTYPEVNRLGQVALPTRSNSGELDVPGLGKVQPGFTRTDGGVFAFGPLTPESFLVLTIEDDDSDIDSDDGLPMPVSEFQDSIRRVLGADLPISEVARLSRYRFQARQAERYREGRIMVAGDAAHLFPATGVGLNAGMLDAVNLAWKLAADVHGWAPADLLDTYHRERHHAGARTMMHTQAQVALRRGTDPAAQALREVFQEIFLDEQPLRRVGALIAGTDLRYPGSDHALTGTFAPDLPLRTGDGETSVAELLRAARPVLLDLADRPDLRDTARPWRDRVDIRTATTPTPPADALLIRPDAHIAWSAADPAVLPDALTRWFGAPSA